MNPNKVKEKKKNMWEFYVIIAREPSGWQQDLYFWELFPTLREAEQKMFNEFMELDDEARDEIRRNYMIRKVEVSLSPSRGFYIK